MPVDFLSDEQVARYRRFRPEMSVAELEQSFRLDAKALDALAGKRRPATKLGVGGAVGQRADARP
jgi:hypothetical protein